MVVRAVALAGLMVAPAAADEAKAERDAFVENNLIHILYHEAAHAVIDQFGLPVVGQEEDAADAFATFEVLNTFDAPGDILFDTALAWHIMDERSGGAFELADYYDEHDLDIQRALRTVCHLVGIDPDRYGEVADWFQIDAQRQESCETDAWMASDSWEVLIEPHLLADGAVSKNVAMDIDDAALSADQKRLVVDSGVMADFKTYLETTFDWPAKLTVSVEACGEANAFYDPNTVEIIMCTEMVDFLADLAVDM